ncbi:4-(cytidine 5'-diphospho)-2-C-methyl-D-erythritol kinase [Donghicola tyrosinivorans]|uniref:4-diphosphocytidyl-2-C-methyl-D-erythritol kinase n=1 Tax=Donghicola tyrosinivorans TaxID=1652492 RepID=A0A2T0X050_9RHOB|nr:4-(cytidine 5'-diphospho)-2-C-methyl-D-erythritol kinase [Donghicola tyrosinivorans]PRY92275.1 4-diphosphocytidyl-2-C-methyl-D-erythritol kinase [Donghicola tyrosinivorans]
MANRAFAPAKVNLALHVTGQRQDGYHLLDSLVVFVGIGDRITVSKADDLSLTVTGPRAAGVPTGPENLVLKAATLLRGDQPLGAQISLEKNLPAAAGIGGGSSDAAATLRALAALWQCDLPNDNGLSLGADVPVCLTAQSCRMEGIGEQITPLPNLPTLHMVLVNPGVEVPTPVVFKGLASKDNPAMEALPQEPSTLGFIAWLGRQRNDLEPPARAHAPEITAVLDAMAATDQVLLHRMSGSGATCFALYPSMEAAAAAAIVLKQTNTDWWVASGQTGSFA